jgi:hypothetical protein
MRQIKLTSNIPNWPWLRQTSGEKGIWKDCQFSIDNNTKECDWWIIYDGLTKGESAICSKENIILITAEPPSIKSYNSDFINQFGIIVTCQNQLKHPSVILRQQSLPWMVGIKFVLGRKDQPKIFSKNYDELKRTNLHKTKLISVISSSKNSTPGHRARLKFIEELKKHFGDKIDVFGRGTNEISDKWDCIAPYKYHIVLENSTFNNYWTEKLSDAFLAQAFPIYYGCQNILDYFPINSLSQIDIDDPKKSIQTIENAMGKDFFEKFKENVLISKDLVLDKYQLFPNICDIINQIEHDNISEKKLITLHPEKTGSVNEVIKKFKSILKI